MNISANRISESSATHRHDRKVMVVRLSAKVESSDQSETTLALHDCGVPFPQGISFDVRDLTLFDGDGQRQRFDHRVMSCWPDGSLQWVRLKWQSHPRTMAYRLEIIANTNLNSETSGRDISLASSSETSRNDDPMTLAGVTFDPQVTLTDGIILKWLVDEKRQSDSGSITHQYDLCGRAVDSQGRTCIEWHAQVQLSVDAVNQHWCLTLRNPNRAIHPGGIWELGDPNSLQIHSARIAINSGIDAAENNNVTVHSRLDRSSPWHSGNSEWRLSQLGSGGPNHASAIHRQRDSEVHVPCKGYRLLDGRKEYSGDQATPSLIVEREDGSSLGVHVPFFWQNYPKGLQWDGREISLHVFPEESNYPHELQPGEQTTIMFRVATGHCVEAKQHLDADPVFVRVDPEWVCRTAYIPWLSPRSKTKCPKYFELVNQAIEGNDTYFQKRERIDQYGWRHFGDVWGDHEAVHSDPDDPLVSHYNNQYDMVLGLGLNYLRGGDEKWLELMKDLARHTIDIDIYHTDEDLSCYNHGMFWHTVHYIDAGLSTHRTYPKGTCGGGPSSGHAYSRGLLLYYCLTGDETAKEAVINMGDWMIASEDGSKTKYRWLARGETGLTTASGTETYHGPGRGPGNCVEVLVTAFQLTHERRYLDQAEHIIRRVVHPDQDIEALELTDAENKWFYLLFLQALGRYLEVKISMNEIDEMYGYGKLTLLHYGDWMAENEKPFLDEPEKLEFPTETWAAQEMRKVEVFQWAARHADPARRERFLERARFFFDTSIEQLNHFPETKSCCRPIALLLTSGYSHDFFRQGGLDRIAEAPPAPEVTFTPQQRFVSQKSRAIRNAKIVAATGAITMLVAFLLGAVWLLSS